MKNLKALVEQRADLQEELNKLVSTADTEERAMSEEEAKKFDEIESKINALDGTIDREERARAMDMKRIVEQQKIEVEERAGSDIVTAFVRGQEVRAGEMTTTTNGNIIPSDFSTDIIRKVEELSGIYSAVGKVNSTGTYKQIVEKNKITAGWTNELAEVTASSADFDIIEIGHHKLGALAKLSYEIINQANFPIANEVMQQMVDAFVLKAEEGIIKGTGVGQPTGLMSGGTAFKLASATAITADEVIKIYHALKAPYLPNAEWLVSRNTLCAIRLLKDANGQYLFHEAELTSGYVGYILGKPVLLTEVTEDYQIMFGDFNRAYKANVNPQMTIQILNEVYASQGAKGVLGFMFLDGKPVNNEAYVVAKAV
ncbi:phage major capsid protein [Lachnoclostridium sp.]|uniref:phage major capsid protein n=1 Tax=Lachnoclostridium sp. TaxID=2028282 RepID=UPI00289F84A3|nr:phage major capsid protein [Lachnoclostridium sp.]